MSAIKVVVQQTGWRRMISFFYGDRKVFNRGLCNAAEM